MHKRLSIGDVVWESDLIGSRFTLAIAEFLWAIMLFWAGDTFSRPTYFQMASIMNENMWGLCFLVSSIIQISIVFCNCMHKTWAWYFAGWNCCLWSYTVYSMLSSVYPPPAAIGGEVALAFAAFWIWLRPILTSDK